MKFLLIDTSDRIAMIGVYEDARTLWECRSMTGRPSLGWITRSIEESKNKSSVEFRHLDFLACGIGPGGFTSVRMGMSIAKAMSAAVGLRLVGVNRLESAAAGHHLAHPENSDVVVTLPAAQDLEFVAGYKFKKDGSMSCAHPPRAIEPSAARKLAWVFDGVQTQITPELFFKGVPAAALRKASLGEYDLADALVPLYLRGPTLGPAGQAMSVAKKLRVSRG